MQASQDGNTQVVEYLCEKGANINHKIKVSICLAAIAKVIYVFYVMHFCFVCLLQGTHWSALTTACRKKREDIAKILVKAGADILQKKEVRETLFVLHNEVLHYCYRVD